jgi:hydrogenase small subunit
MSTHPKEFPVIWIQGSGCSGCSVSVLNALSPGINNALIDEIVPGSHICLLFHPTVMAGAGEPAISVIARAEEELQSGFVLIVEGAIATAEEGSFAVIGEYEGKHLTISQLAFELASRALAVIALGTCASFGGIPKGAPNPTGVVNVETFLKMRGLETSLINIPGCPPHPEWLLGTVANVIMNNRLPEQHELDELRRPKQFFAKTIHENCQRRADFDAGKFADSFGQAGCLFKLGCKGPFTNADCPIRKWNSGVNWCVENGSPCLGCCEPEFPDRFAPLYEKITESRLDQFKVGGESA